MLSCHGFVFKSGKKKGKLLEKQEKRKEMIWSDVWYDNVVGIAGWLRHVMDEYFGPSIQRPSPFMVQRPAKTCQSFQHPMP